LSFRLAEDDAVTSALAPNLLHEIDISPMANGQMAVQPRGEISRVLNRRGQCNELPPPALTQDCAERLSVWTAIRITQYLQLIRDQQRPPRIEPLREQKSECLLIRGYQQLSINITLLPITGAQADRSKRTAGLLPESPAKVFELLIRKGLVGNEIDPLAARIQHAIQRQLADQCFAGRSRCTHDHPRNGSWTALRVRPARCLARHDEAE